MPRPFLRSMPWTGAVCFGPNPSDCYGKKPEKSVQNASNIWQDQPAQSLFCKPGRLDTWICQQCQIHEGMNILELGCGDGALWTQNLSKLPGNLHITLSDISEGMLRDVRRAIGGEDPGFSFKAFDCHNIPPRIGTFDLVICQSCVLFYCDDIGKVCKNVTKSTNQADVFFAVPTVPDICGRSAF